MSGRVAGRALDDVERVLDHVEVAQAEEVHLQQADLLDRLHRELRHRPERRARRPRPVPASASCSGTMSVSGRSAITTAAAWIEELRTIPSRPLATSMICARLRLLVVGLAQRFARFQAVLEGRGATHDRVGDQLGKAVAGAIVAAEHAGCIAGGGAREHLAEGDDLSDRLASVLLGDVAHHALAPTNGEVDVDIGHRHALGVEEALEQEVVAQRVDIGDRHAVGDDRAGRRTASRADGDAVLLGELDEVPDDQEVGVEAHAIDHAKLHVHACDRLGRRRISVAHVQATQHLLA